ncbi:Cytosolic carboxypeptidase-like protein 5 [Homalodisca vitripennis]|nr:Cytosolic carboxypeptidase-like protein 5 [Homalodisca vitripennis]
MMLARQTMNSTYGLYQTVLVQNLRMAIGLGGAPFALVKLNMVNLNRQTKMYSQGMAPVFRISPGRNNWERIRDKPTFNNEDNVFTMSFKYRTLENLRAVTYFAFTFPYSYSELQANLNLIDSKFLTSNIKPHLNPEPPALTVVQRKAN